jgi:hypothetical protein
MVCPTVFNLGNRTNNSPFSQSSWFLRPITATNDNTEEEGSAVEYRPFYRLKSPNNCGGEIQCMGYDTGVTLSNADDIDFFVD